MMNKSREVLGSGRHRFDFALSNGALVDFKVAIDETGTPVVSQLLITFDTKQPPAGGIGGSSLREIRISDLLADWFLDSSNSFLNSSQEQKLWNLVSRTWPRSGRNGSDESLYAALAYFYVRFHELYPNSPTAKLASELNISVKTVSTRLAVCRRLQFLTTDSSIGKSGKASGRLTRQGKQIVQAIIDEA